MSEHKLARNRSADSAQEALRQRKQVWNTACSDFIARINAFKPALISFKRGLNGRGDQKAGLPVSDIKFPLPTEVVSYLGKVSSEFESLANTFSGLVNEASGINQEQTEYARSRQQPIVQRRQALLQNDLEKEASSPLSRFWAHLSSYFSSDELKAQRLSILGMTHQLFKNLIELEDFALSKGTDNIPQLLKQYFLVSNNIKALDIAFKTMSNTMINKPKPETPRQEAPKSEPFKREPTQEKIPAPTVENVETKKETSDTEELRRNVLLLVKQGLISQKDYDSFFFLIHKFKTEQDENKKLLMRDRIKDIYDGYMKVSKAFNTTEEMIKNASNPLSRLFKEYRQRFGIKEPSTAARIELVQIIREAKKQTDQLMDAFESKEIDAKDLSFKITVLIGLLAKMNEPIQLLNVIYENKYFDTNKTMKEVKIDPTNRYFMRKMRKNVDRY